MQSQEKATKQRIIFGGGCFWCTEAVFQMLRGVEVKTGYAGGKNIQPSYEKLIIGDVEHAEVIEIIYDTNIINLEILLEVFFATHDPTSLNKQGADVGIQYRSVIFYTSQQQKQDIENFIQKLGNKDRIVTVVTPLDHFYEAEEYHQNFYQKNTDSPYCQVVINPKIEKIKKDYSHLIKDNI